MVSPRRIVLLRIHNVEEGIRINSQQSPHSKGTQQGTLRSTGFPSDKTMQVRSSWLLRLLIVCMSSAGPAVVAFLPTCRRPRGHHVTMVQGREDSRTFCRALSRRTESPAVSSTPPSASSSSSLHAAVQLAHIEWTTGEAPPPQPKPPVVFLHGLLGNKKNFSSLARSLSQQLQTKRRIFGLDMRNHGDNIDDWREDMSYPAMAADVVAFLDGEGLDQVVLVGHSMGGKIAQTIALLHAERVNGLVVLDMAPVEYKEEEDSTWQAVCNIVRHLDRVVQESDDRLTKKDVDKALRTEISDPALRAFCLTNWDDKEAQWKIPMGTISHQLGTLAAFDVQPKGAESVSFAGDAFFIHGGQSRFVRHGHLTTIGEFFPNHMLTTIRGSGHWVHAEAPEAVGSLLLQFLDR